MKTSPREKRKKQKNVNKTKPQETIENAHQSGLST